MAAETRRVGKRRKPSNGGDLLEAEEGTSDLEGSGFHRTSASAATNGHLPHATSSVRGEAWNMALLVVLYAMQGVPLGLTLGSMPFLLQARASYTQIGLFSVASYPYSFKLLWSPIVDSVYSLAFGRRKSWVVPIQLASAVLLLTSADWAEARLQDADVAAITGLFFVLVLLAATQDIAVDGWALTLLSRQHVGYASTCQTVGMNVGYFTSFTVFLALNDPDFCNSYLRAEPQPAGILPLSTYLRFWGWVFIVVTVAVAAFKRERNFQPPGDDSDAEGEWGDAPPARLADAYGQLWGVIRLPAVQRFALVLMAFRLGMLPAEQAAPLKLLEKGVSKEALAGLVLLEFPCELLSALVAGRWAASPTPFAPWLVGYRVRLLMAAVVTGMVWAFPPGAASLTDHPRAFAALAVAGLATSFTSTLMFTAAGSFFNRISDPDMGGAYLTLLNTIANMGVILPKLVMFSLMDVLTTRGCQPPPGKGEGDGADLLASCPANRLAAEGDNPCTQAGGQCVIIRDGYYLLSYCCVGLGCLLLLHFRRVLPKLEALPPDAWRAKAVARKL